MLYIVGKDDKILFGTIGKLALDPDVHKQIGYHVSTRDGDIWSVTKNARSFMVGTPFSNKYIKIRLIYFDNKIAFTTLIDQIRKYAIANKFISIKANDLKSNADYWELHGFKMTGLIGKNFANYETDFKDDK